MRWLVTAPADADLVDVVGRLHGLGCTAVDIDAAMPVDPGEIVVPVVGPSNLDVLVGDDPLLTGAYANSDAALYE